jgi:hypothetical protein
VQSLTYSGARNRLAVLKDKKGVIWDATRVEDQSALDEIPDEKLKAYTARITRIQLIVDTQENTYHTFIRRTSLALKRDCSRLGDGHLEYAVGEFTQWRKDHKSVLSERHLLWHGSHITNFPGILRNGLRRKISRKCYFWDTLCGYDGEGSSIL